MARLCNIIFEMLLVIVIIEAKVSLNQDISLNKATVQNIEGEY